MKEKAEATFTVPIPRDVENVYELVVIAALRARQLNQFPHLREREKPGTLVDQALHETLGRKVAFDLAEKPEPKVTGTEIFEG
jgi:DNA-directed RNA polymerase subunit K/omega